MKKIWTMLVVTCGLLLGSAAAEKLDMPWDDDPRDDLYACDNAFIIMVPEYEYLKSGYPIKTWDEVQSDPALILIHKHLCQIQGELLHIKEDMREIKHRLPSSILRSYR